jgi:hypothetical protein
MMFLGLFTLNILKFMSIEDLKLNTAFEVFFDNYYILNLDEL